MWLSTDHPKAKQSHCPTEATSNPLLTTSWVAYDLVARMLEQGTYISSQVHTCIHDLWFARQRMCLGELIFSEGFVFYLVMITFEKAC